MIEDYDWHTDWECPATRQATEPSDRGHRFNTVYRADPRDPETLFCERCGRAVRIEKGVQA